MNTEKTITASREESLWMGTTPLSHYPVLEHTHTTEVAIVGGGIAGLAAAYRLIKNGKRVTVIEAAHIATGTSGYTTAKVTSLHGLRYTQLEKNFGKHIARQYGEAHEWALEEMASIIHHEHIDCDFKRLPSYTYATDLEEQEQVKKEARVAEGLGLPASYVSQDGLPFPTFGAVKFENQACFHPRKFLLALAEKLVAQGGEVYEKTRVVKIAEKEDHILLTTENGQTITANQVVVATNYPIYDTAAFFSRMGQMRSYALAVKTSKPAIRGMYLSAGKDERSLRPQQGQEGDWLIIGGGSHPTGSPEFSEKEQYQKLEAFARETFAVESFGYRWSAQDSLPIDSLPYIGRMPRTENVYVTTGYGEWGMTTSFVSARILTELILGRDSKWADMFSPERLNIKASVKGAVRQVKEVVKGYGAFLKDEGDIESIAPGEGKIITCQGKKCAVSRDAEGKICALSAVCTHMGCIVNWNSAEKTWDCPCHGSRFSRSGAVITGPATKPLPEQEVEEEE